MQPGDNGAPRRPIMGGRNEIEHRLDRRLRQLRPLGEVAAVILATGAEQQTHAVKAKAVHLVDGAQHAQLLMRLGHAETGQQAVEQLAVIDADAHRYIQRLEARDRHGDDFRVGLGAIGADDVRIALHEFAQAAGPRLFIAPDRSEGIAPEGLGQGFPVLRGKARQRRRQVIAQGHPLVVVVLKREDADIGPVRIGQELAERVGIFESRSLQGLEAVRLVHSRHGVDDAAFDRDRLAALVGKAARRARFGTEGLVLIGIWVGILAVLGHGAAIAHRRPIYKTKAACTLQHEPIIRYPHAFPLT